jgi:hypothetical protein
MSSRNCGEEQEIIEENKTIWHTDNTRTQTKKKGHRACHLPSASTACLLILWASRDPIYPCQKIIAARLKKKNEVAFLSSASECANNWLVGKGEKYGGLRIGDREAIRLVD